MEEFVILKKLVESSHFMFCSEAHGFIGFPRSVYSEIMSAHYSVDSVAGI